VWVADSFRGLPQAESNRADDVEDALWTYDFLAVPIERVKANFARYGLLDEQVRFLPGWFEDTLPTAPISQIAVLRLDGDMYDSTMVALRSLYPKLSVGGYVIVDDYHAVPRVQGGRGRIPHRARNRRRVASGRLDLPLLASVGMR